MNKNEQKNPNNNEVEIISLGFALSDLLYAQYRKKLEESRIKLEIDPHSELNCAGIVIVSEINDEGDYSIQNTSFGSVDDIINILAHVLIEKLRRGSSPDRETRETVLTSFMDFFIQEAKATLLTNCENDIDLQ